LGWVFLLLLQLAACMVGTEHQVNVSSKLSSRSSYTWYNTQASVKAVKSLSQIRTAMRSELPECTILAPLNVMNLKKKLFIEKQLLYYWKLFAAFYFRIFSREELIRENNMQRKWIEEILLFLMVQK
jgi:hypothetical protein